MWKWQGKPCANPVHDEDDRKYLYDIIDKKGLQNIRVRVKFNSE